MRIGLELAEKAAEMAPEEPGGYQMLSLFAMSKRDYEQAMVYRQKALRLAPNDYLVLYGLGTLLLNAGEPEQAIDILKRAMRMNPNHTDALSWTIAEAHLVAEDYEAAIETSSQAVARQPDAMFPHIFMAAAYGAVGRLEEAQAEAAKVLHINPKFTVSAWMKSRLLKDPADTERYANFL